MWVGCDREREEKHGQLFEIVIRGPASLQVTAKSALYHRDPVAGKMQLTCHNKCILEPSQEGKRDTVSQTTRMEGGMDLFAIVFPHLVPRLVSVRSMLSRSYGWTRRRCSRDLNPVATVMCFVLKKEKRVSTRQRRETSREARPRDGTKFTAATKIIDACHMPCTRA